MTACTCKKAKVQCFKAKEQIFWFYLIFDKRHVYLLGSAKNQRNIGKVTDLLEIQQVLCIQYTLYRAGDITQNC